MGIDMVGRVRALFAHLWEGCRLEWEGNRVHNVPTYQHYCHKSVPAHCIDSPVSSAMVSYKVNVSARGNRQTPPFSPVQRVELGVRHGIEMLENYFNGIVVLQAGVQTIEHYLVSHTVKLASIYTGTTREKHINSVSDSHDTASHSPVTCQSLSHGTATEHA